MAGTDAEVRVRVDGLRRRLDGKLAARPRPHAPDDDHPLSHPVRQERTRRQFADWRREMVTELRDLAVNVEDGQDGTDVARIVLTADERERLRPAVRRALKGVADADLRTALSFARENRWFEASAASRRAIRLRTDTASAAGVTLKPSAQAHAVEALATYMIEGNSPRLRAKLAGLDRTRSTPGLKAFHAQLLIIAGRYGEARQVLADTEVRNHPSAQALLGLTGETSSGVWQRFPCNFYTYRYTLIPNSAGPNEPSIDAFLPVLAQLEGDDAALAALGVHPDDRPFVVRQAMDALACFRGWNDANAALASKNYLLAVRTYQDTADRIRAYFRTWRGTDDPKLMTTAGAKWRYHGRDVFASPAVVTHFRRRYGAVTLRDLYEIDWERPLRGPAGYRPYSDPRDLIRTYGSWAEKANEKIDAALLTIANALIPLAVAEASLARRRFDDNDDAPGVGTISGAEASVSKALKEHARSRILCELIERPFAVILKGRILLQKGDAQYKARLPASSPQLDPNGNLLYQGLQAAKTYRGVADAFRDGGYLGYVANVRQALEALRAETADLLGLVHDTTVVALRDQLPPVPNPAPVATPAQRVQLRQLGIDPRLPTLHSVNAQLVGLATRRAEHGRLIAFDEDGVPPRESNPVIYALVAEAKARLAQLEGGFNFIGYRDDFVPPWRFHHLLERARHYALHTRQVQSTYLTFLANAEREELQEQSASQTSVLDQASVAVQTRRLDQAALALDAAHASTQLADLTARNAQQRFDSYLSFDRRMDAAASSGLFGSFLGAGLGLAVGAATGGAGAVAAIGGIFGLAGQISEKEMQNLQRELEKENLRLAAGEARQSAVVAAKQEATSAVAVQVAALERVAAVMRHDFSVQTLQFLRNRTLNAEMWYRLADQLRTVAEGYLRQAVELAFFAEQAFEFETSRRVDVVRFDYDISEFADSLAADFLLRDLDTLEHELITTETRRRQYVRFVVSMARDYPETLEQLRETGSCLFTVSLRQLEQRFPGLYNLRIASASVTPVAVADPTRFALQLTHLGSSSMRIRSPHTTPDDATESPEPLDRGDVPSWCAPLDARVDVDWPVKIHVSPPDTQVFTPLTRAEEAVPDAIGVNQRNAFEALGAASTWRIDLSMRENRMRPETLSDVIVSFGMTGYHSDDLKSRVLTCIPAASVQTAWLSGQRSYPDAYFAFQNGGAMTWRVDDRVIPDGLVAGRTRNLGVLLLCNQPAVSFGRLVATRRVRVDVAANGSVTVVGPLPGLTLAVTGLTVEATVTPDGTADTATIDFGDGGGFEAATAGTALAHTYRRPGRYTARLRVERGDRLDELTASVAVAGGTDLPPPFTPGVTVQATGQTANAVTVQVDASGVGVSAADLMVAAGSDRRVARGSVTLDLARGREHQLTISLVRDLTAGLHSRRRFVPATRFVVQGLRAATNRTFDAAGNDTTAAPNALATHLFGPGPLAAEDDWTLDVSAADNPFLLSLDPSGVPAPDLSELRDAILSIEYEAEGTGS